MSELKPRERHERADALYALRAERENVRASVRLLEAAGTEDAEAAWRLGRAHFFLGQETEAADEAIGHHAAGASAARRAARLQPERVEGHFWLGVNLALRAQREGKGAGALFHALCARRALERAVRLEPGYHGAGPLRVLARLTHKLPRWLGGGSVRAHDLFARAVELAPANTVTRLYFAELLLHAGDEPAARQQLTALLAAPHDPAWAYEQERDRQLAHASLQEQDRESRTQDSELRTQDSE